MIKVSRLNAVELVVNADLIEFVEATPDTIITLTTGKKLVVRESVDEIINRVIDYKGSIGQARVRPRPDLEELTKE
ncbi:MAG: flagellar FlbD family protein [Clostridia bacterium]|nr:flagellar FlbD family protein [Clostridia bacterium]